MRRIAESRGHACDLSLRSTFRLGRESVEYEGLQSECCHVSLCEVGNPSLEGCRADVDIDVDAKVAESSQRNHFVDSNGGKAYAYSHIPFCRSNLPARLNFIQTTIRFRTSFHFTLSPPNARSSSSPSRLGEIAGRERAAPSLELCRSSKLL